MDNLSDDSDVDIDEVRKMVGNLDDLDNDLFGDALLKDNTYSANKSRKNMKDTQKKVAFQDFDDDDNLLNDILSDSVDSNKNSKPSINAKDNKIANLFGTKSVEVTGININNPSKLSEPRKNDIINSSNDDDWMIMNKSGSITSRSTIGKSADNVDSISNNIPLKIGVTSGLKSDTAKKSSLMEDLFGTRSRAASLKDIYSGPLDKNLIGTEESVSASMPNLVKNDQPSKPSISSAGFQLSSSVNKEPRRGRPKSGMIDDPLGLLTGSDKISDEPPPTIKERFGDVEKQTSNVSDDLPEWLGGKKKINQTEEKRGSGISPKVEENKYKNDDTAKIEQKISQQSSFLYPAVPLFAGAQFEQQSAIVAMQQQEHELRTATILSHQTDQLNLIVESQKNKMEEQEKLFDSLIKRQVDRQAILESQIKLQQARIDHYIQALVKQPPITLSSASGSLNDRNTSQDNKEDENCKVESESLLHTLQVEKNSLEHMVEILKEKHEREIKIYEDSHETQIRFMQEAMNKLEVKLRREIEELEKDYQKKIDKLSTEKNQQELYFNEQMENIRTNQQQRIEEIYNRHSDQIAWLQKEHGETIENIVHAKELERNTIDFIRLHKTDLDNMIKQSQHIFSSVEKMSEQINTKNSDIISKRENYLKNQEETLKALIEQLQMQQETLDNEKKQLAIVAQELKSETSKLSIYFQKNTELYTEREARHGMQERMFMRERELFQEQCKWEREHLQSLKESWIAEQQQQIKLLSHEREAIAAEKAKLEVLNSFKSNSDDITKAELEAALKTAHNATYETNLERQRWQERSDNLEADRRRIEEKEKQLLHRAKELDELTRSAFLKRDEGIAALKEAQRIEKQYKDRMGQLQMQLEAMAERENKLAVEKIALARDRLALKVCQSTDKPEKDVTNDSLRKQINESFHIPLSDIPTHFKVINSEINLVL
ncbi:hypothetical protein PV328_010492 [Microctonus aethiopoides]|uniref:Fas-binding factor 1 C-terminal domain-containing protein n=1 Tax=Microctonus aethiopoides TaxID=144406 RepID=A0AA39KQC9_9HYME|nr:hypothetical protein PV328_010492 [Microctonus aethiopoides]